jgi:hypothetical protein
MAFRRHRADSVPIVAAEVLEARSLLSAGAGAAHAALQHAGSVHHPSATTVPATGQITANGNPTQYSGQLTLSPINPVKISPVHAHFQFSDAQHNSFSVSISGTIVENLREGNLTKLGLANVHGTGTQVTVTGGHRQTRHLVISLPAEIDLNLSNAFVSFQAAFTSPAQHGLPAESGFVLLYV